MTNPPVLPNPPSEPASRELTLTTGAPANGGSCVARHDGRVVFVRYALPGERVRARVTEDRGTYLHAVATEVLEPSEHRIDSLCPVAGPGGAGCCDLAFAAPGAARALKAEVVANQLEHVGGYRLPDDASLSVETIGSGEATGWRTRARFTVGLDGRAGYLRYRSNQLVDDAPNCGQLPPGMLAGVADRSFPPRAEVHVVIDDDGTRHVISSGPWQGREPHGRGSPRPKFQVVEGGRMAVQRIGDRRWQVPVTGFWQSHREAARVYSAVVTDWADLSAGMTAWDLYGGAGVFAAALAPAVGALGQVVSVDSSRTATAAGRTALADLPQITVVTDSVKRMLTGQRERADVAVLDPPRAGAGKAVIGLLADAGVPRIIHFGCEVAAFARDIGLYRERGYSVSALRVFDAFPLTHHVECAALLVANQSLGSSPGTVISSS